MFLVHTDATDASENDDFPTDVVILKKALQTGGPTDRKNRRTNQPMDRHSSYRDPIAASKNLPLIAKRYGRKQ